MMITVAALFTKDSGNPATGLTLADIDIYLYSRNKSTGVVATVWSALHPTEEVGGGQYTRAYVDDAQATYEYFAYARYTGATTLDSTYSLMSDVGVDLADIWAYGASTSTVTVVSALSGTAITLRARATNTVTFTGLTISASWEKIWLTFKRDPGDADAASVIQVLETNPPAVTDGLIYLNGVAATAAQASLTVNQAAGSIVAVITDDASDDLTPIEGLVYDVKQLVASATTILTEGTAAISYAVTAAIA